MTVKTSKRPKTYTETEMATMFRLFKDGASIDEIWTAVSDRHSRPSVVNKLVRMGLTRR